MRKTETETAEFYSLQESKVRGSVSKFLYYNEVSDLCLSDAYLVDNKMLVFYVNNKVTKESSWQYYDYSDQPDLNVLEAGLKKMAIKNLEFGKLLPQVSWPMVSWVSDYRQVTIQNIAS